MDKKEYLEVIKMFDKLYRDLYKSDIVLSHASNKYDKFCNIKNYIERLEYIHKKTKNKPYYIRILKKFYYDKYIIKFENIPDNYHLYENTLLNERKELYENIVKIQKESLDIWINYLINIDYPMWIKFWVFQGMLKLGTYDCDHFNKRSRNNTNGFAELNEDALERSIKYVLENKSNSFNKVYEYMINNQKVKNDDGIWIKYAKGSDPFTLVKSIRGYNTGWCTVWLSVARFQLNNGDFYVYYTKDKNNEYKRPRIAIRMKNSRIYEVRGIFNNQNIETCLEKVVENKIKTLENLNKYKKRLQDMENLERICNSNSLNKDDLCFLYEIDKCILGFGYEKDPRIEKVLAHRDIKHDLSRIFACKQDNIALSICELVCNNCNYLYGNIDGSNQKYLNSLKVLIGNLNIFNNCNYYIFLEKVIGNVEIYSINSDLSNLSNLQVVVGDMSVIAKSACGLYNLRYVDKDFKFGNYEFPMRSAEGLNNLRYIGGNGYFYSLYYLDGIRNLVIEGDAYFMSLKSLDGLDNITVKGKLYLNPKLEYKVKIKK